MKEPTLAEFEQSLKDALRKGHENNTEEGTLQALVNMLDLVQVYRAVYQVFRS
jgi:hypothetical protein